MSATELTVDQLQEKFGQLPTAREFFYDWGGFNVWLFKAINGIHGPVYDALMTLIAELGNEKHFFIIMAVLAGYALLGGLWRKLFKKGGMRQHLLMWFGAFMVICIGLAVMLPAKNYLQAAFAYPRPYAALEASEVTVIEHRGRLDSHRSFPSGHVSFITLMIAGLWPVLSNRMRWAGATMIFLVSWSRVALGVHFPADAAGGFLMTLLIVVALRWFLYSCLRKIGLNCGGA